tara:strand:- start:386 stop:586 length:201 start_codon:yes stop_codon:yes gene_type:complete
MANHSTIVSDALLKEAERVNNSDMDFRNYEFAVRIKSNGSGQRSLEIVSQVKGQLSEEANGSIQEV